MNEMELLRRLEENDRLFLRRFCGLLDGTFRRVRAAIGEELLMEKLLAIERSETKKLERFLAGEVMDVLAIGEAHAAVLCRDKVKQFEKKKLSNFVPWFMDGGRKLAKLMEIDPENFWLKPTEAIEAFQLRENMLAKDVSGVLWQDVRKIMSEHLEGVPRKDTQGKLEQLEAVTERRAELIVTTESTYAYNRGRLAGFKKAGADYVRFSAVMDLRTSPQCRSRHGKVMRLDSAELAGNTPPLHGRCRSILSPIYSAYEPEAITAENTDWSKVTPLPKGWRTATPDVTKPAYLRMENAAEHRAVAEIVRADMARLPKRHQELLKKHDVRVTFGHDVAHFKRQTGELAIARQTVPGEFIHEAGHAIETYLKLYEDKKFVEVLRSGIPENEISQFHFVLENFGMTQVGYLHHPKVTKFLTDYQACSYEIDLLGRERFIAYGGREIFNVSTLGEYFAEGYRAFFMEAELLKAKDGALYKFIEELVR